MLIVATATLAPRLSIPPALGQELEPRQIERDVDPDSARVSDAGAARRAADRADLLLFDAETLLREGQYNPAIATLKEVTRLAPDRVPAWMALATAYGLLLESTPKLSEADADTLAVAAVAAYRRVLEIEPRHRLALNGLSLLGARFSGPPEQSLHSAAAKAQWAAADSALTAGDAAGAADRFRALARLEPNAPAVHRRLAEALRRIGAHGADIRHALDEALRLNPADAKALAMLGGVALDEGHPAEAQRWLRAAFELAPFDTLTRGALRRLEAAAQPETPAARAEHLFYLGRIALAEGKSDEAISKLSQAVGLDSAGTDYQKFLGIAYFSAKQFGPSLPFLRGALNLQGEDPDLPFYIGGALYYLEEYEIAAAYLGPAANAHRPRGEAARLMALTLARLGNQAEGAVYYLEQALREGSPDPQLPCLLGEMYVRIDRWADARVRFEECARQNPGHPSALLGQGLTADHEGRPREAVDYLRRFLERQPASPAVQMRLGLALLKLGQPDSATFCFRAVLRSDTTFADLKPDSLSESQLLDVVFVILMAGRNTEDGIVVGERLVALEPNNPGFANNLAMAYADAERHLDRALALAQQARRANPTDGGILDTYGWVLAKLTRHEEARRTLLKAVDLTLKSDRPDASEIYFHLGYLLAAMRRPKEAVEWARKSLENSPNPLVEQQARGLLERLGSPAGDAN